MTDTRHDPDEFLSFDLPLIDYALNQWIKVSVHPNRSFAAAHRVLPWIMLRNVIMTTPPINARVSFQAPRYVAEANQLPNASKTL